LDFDIAALGEAEGHFRVGGFHYRLLQIGGILGILVGLGIVGLAVLVPILAPPARGIRDWPLLIKFGIIGVGALAAGGAAWSRSRSYRGLQILVCTRGLVWMRPDGDEAIQWEAVSALRNLSHSGHEAGGSLRPNLQFVIEYGADQKIVLDETLYNFNHLREMVEERTLDHLLASALEELREDVPVSFGPIVVSPQGINVKKHRLPWRHYGQGVAEKGEVAIYDRDQGKAFCKVKMAEVPNVHVLLALADFFSRSAEPEPNPGGDMGQ
jgi:hypothetical protein